MKTSLRKQFDLHIYIFFFLSGASDIMPSLLCTNHAYSSLAYLLVSCLLFPCYFSLCFLCTRHFLVSFFAYTILTHFLALLSILPDRLRFVRYFLACLLPCFLACNALAHTFLSPSQFSYTRCKTCVPYFLACILLS